MAYFRISGGERFRDPLVDARLEAALQPVFDCRLRSLVAALGDYFVVGNVRRSVGIAEK